MYNAILYIDLNSFGNNIISLLCTYAKECTTMSVKDAIIHTRDKYKNGARYLVFQCNYIDKNKEYYIYRISCWHKHPKDYFKNETEPIIFQISSIQNIKFYGTFGNLASGIYKLLTNVPTPSNDDILKEFNSFTYKNDCIQTELDKTTIIENYDKNKLQGEETPGGFRREGRILYGRRDVFKYTAGRHCDKAGVKNQRTRTREYKVILSSRIGKVLKG